MWWEELLEQKHPVNVVEVFKRIGLPHNQSSLMTE